MFGKKRKAKKEIEEKSAQIQSFIDDLDDILKNDDRAPRSYVCSRQPITLEDANEILHHATMVPGVNQFISIGLDVAYCSPPPNSPRVVMEAPLQQLLMSFIQQVDGGKYLTDDYTFLEYFHPASCPSPKKNEDKEYYILTPIKKK